MILDMACQQCRIALLISLGKNLGTDVGRLKAAVKAKLGKLIVGRSGQQQGGLMSLFDIDASVLLRNLSTFMQDLKLGGKPHVLASLSSFRAVFVHHLPYHSNLIPLYGYLDVLFSFQSYEHVQTTFIRSRKMSNDDIVYG